MADSSKTEKATPKKKSDERKKGNIFQSKDITSAFALLGIFAFLRLVAPYYYKLIKNIIIEFLGSFDKINTLSINGGIHYFSKVLTVFVLVVIPIALFAMLIGIIFTLTQTKMLFTMKAIKFKFSKLNPISGFKRLISARSLIELTKSMIKIILIVSVIYSESKTIIGGIVSITDYDIEQTIFWLCNELFIIAVKISLIMIAFGIFDFFYQWWDYERQLKMTKQEVKDEIRQSEGDPTIKSKIKERQRAMARMRMMQNVPLADVVIRNPTHYAVAIKYDPDKDRAPIVVAKGADYLALKIIEIAEKNNVYITENRPLARGLYDAVEVDREIPKEFYQAVAEVLAFIYSLKKKDRVTR